MCCQRIYKSDFVNRTELSNLILHRKSCGFQFLTNMCINLLPSFILTIAENYNCPKKVLKSYQKDVYRREVWQPENFLFVSIGRVQLSRRHRQSWIWYPLDTFRMSAYCPRTYKKNFLTLSNYFALLSCKNKFT